MTQKLFCRLLLVLSLSIGAAWASARAEVQPPETPAGHVLHTWLETLNSGDRDRIASYVQTIDPSQSVAGMIAFRNQTGGFDLLSVESLGANQLRFKVKEKASTTIAVGDLVLEEDPSPKVKVFSLLAVPPGATVTEIAIDAALRRKVIDGINADLDEFYVDGPLAKAMEATLNSQQQAGAYDKVTDPYVFAGTLMNDLRSVSHDKHLTIRFTPFVQPMASTPAAADSQQLRDQLFQSNCAFDKVEMLPNRIGYVKFDAFQSPAVCGPTVVAAMDFIAHSKAVIVDLRENGGGDPEMITFIASYFFDQPTHLNDLYNRHENSTQQFWTLPYSEGANFGKVPVFVLTSSYTFSGAEEFSYDLASQKRATIVGETTGGGAHPVSGHVVEGHFLVGVPFAKAINPVTKTNWEGVGIQPNVKVPASNALTTAQELAAKAIDAEPALGNR